MVHARVAGFSVDPGGATLVAGRYIVKSVQSQVILQGPASREAWLGVDLRRGRRIKSKDHRLDAEW